MNNKLLMIGAGGHCRSVLSSLLSTNRYSEIGIIDKERNNKHLTMGIPVIGCDKDLPDLFAQGYRDAFVAVGSVGDPALRISLFAELERIGFEIPNIIDPEAVLCRDIHLSQGIFIGKNVTINVGTEIGKGSIINTAATIEHDCRIGEFAHVATGVILCGEVKIGDRSHIGAGSVVKQQIEIGADTIIGMGSVVLNNIAEQVVAYGNPCKEERPR